MAGKPLRKPAPFPALPAQESVVECALQLRKIGDKLNLHQKIRNLITKLFCPGT
uniref:Phorbol-12-myristate-13-acetate-induced protein 1 n=1 Tax=Sphenodon punctatus TaxID=8508 RepID=A0A8D0HKG5_SPHPU